jgi:hypothetical protein
VDKRISVHEILNSDYVTKYHQSITSKDVRAFMVSKVPTHIDRIPQTQSSSQTNEQPTGLLWYDSLPHFMLFSWQQPIIKLKVPHQL